MTSKIKLSHPVFRQSGIAMMDVLISLVLISITLVGAGTASNAGIQELRFLNRAAIAMDISKELADHISSHRTPATQSMYEIETSEAVFETHDCIDGCTPEEIAQNNMHLWTKKIVSAIPAAKLKIIFKEDTAIIGILWQESRQQNNKGALCPFEGITQKQYCLAFEVPAKMAKQND